MSASRIRRLNKQVQRRGSFRKPFAVLCRQLPHSLLNLNLPLAGAVARVV